MKVLTAFKPARAEGARCPYVILLTLTVLSIVVLVFAGCEMLGLSKEKEEKGGGVPPNAPSSLAADVVSVVQIDLSWVDNSDDEGGFKIERKTEGETYSEIASVEADVTTYSDEGLSPGTTYYYRVRAYNDYGDSDYSNEASATTEAVCSEDTYVCIGADWQLVTRLFRWNEEDFPLKIYIPEPSPDLSAGSPVSSYGDAVFAGMKKWETALDVISLERASSPDGADIVVEWIEAFPQDWGGEVYVGATEDASGNITFSVTSFKLAVKTLQASTNPGQFFTEADIQKTSTHEMGHALGLGHSPDEGDVMNPAGGTGELSERDIATIRKLYALPNGYKIE